MQNQQLICPHCGSQKYHFTGNIKPVEPPYLEHKCWGCKYEGYESEYKTCNGEKHVLLMTIEEQKEELAMFGYAVESDSSIPLYRQLFEELGIHQEIHSDNFFQVIKNLSQINGYIKIMHYCRGNGNLSTILNAIRWHRVGRREIPAKPVLSFLQ